MTSKTSDRRPFIGQWRIINMELWDREDLDLVGPAQSRWTAAAMAR